MNAITLPLAQKPQLVAEFNAFQAKMKAALLNNVTINKVYELKDRWQDEREFEDFNDYVEVIRSITGLPKLKMTKTFVITVTEGCFEYTAKYPAKGNISGSSKAFVRFTA